MFTCPECGKTFTSESSLIHHRLRAHGVPKPKTPKEREGGGKYPLNLSLKFLL